MPLAAHPLAPTATKLIDHAESMPEGARQAHGACKPWRRRRHRQRSRIIELALNQNGESNNRLSRICVPFVRRSYSAGLRHH